MTPKVFDVAVAGAGPAGSATALLLARAGLSVALVDRSRFPRPKACGEGLMPAGARLLARLGLLGAAAGAQPFAGLRFVARSGASAGVRFRSGRGLVVPRAAFDHQLLQAAARAGARTLEGLRAAPLVEGGRAAGLRLGERGERLRARVCVFADGCGSSCARALGVRSLCPKPRRFGLSGHLAGVRAPKGTVQVLFIDGGELYVAPQAEPGVCLVALLAEGAALRRWAALGLPAALAACAAARGWLERPRLLDGPRGAGPFAPSPDRLAGPGWLLAGDAAGAVDPVSGSGISLALAGAVLAAREARRRLERADGDYAREHSRLLRRARRLSRTLVALSRRPRLADRVLRALDRWPSLARLFWTEDLEP